MDVPSYPPPVDKLLTLGDGRKVAGTMNQWSTYLELGLGPEHIPDLIRMATDEELRWAYSDTLEVWAPIHAWRALGQLRAEAAIEPLFSLFEESKDDEWVMDELPEIYGMIGPAAIPALTAYLADDSHLDETRITAISCLEKIGTIHPEARAECVAVLSRQLEAYKENDPEVNAFLISHLIDLKALEAAPVIERAFAADRVYLDIAGDWDDVQIELGLKSPGELLQTQYRTLFDASAQSMTEERVASPGLSYSEPSRKRNVAPNKVRRKMVKQSRKKNRRHK
jgi:hypothetical protein